MVRTRGRGSRHGVTGRGGHHGDTTSSAPEETVVMKQEVDFNVDLLIAQHRQIPVRHTGLILLHLHIH